MKTGIGFPSYTAQAVWAAQSGPWDANYPPTVLGDLVRPSHVARSSMGGTAVATAVLPASAPVRMFALVNHDMPAGATFQIQAYSTTNPDGTMTGIVYDSGALQAWPAGGPIAGVRSVRPVVLPAEITMRSMRLVLFDAGAPVSIGAVEISGLWEWPGISPGRELGYRELGGSISLVGGAKHRPAGAGPRIVNGAVDLMAMAITSSTGLDAQVGLDLQKPFVWAQDYDDASTWVRTCMLVRNEEVPPMVGRLYRHDAFPIRLVEHVR